MSRHAAAAIPAAASDRCEGLALDFDITMPSPKQNVGEPRVTRHGAELEAMWPDFRDSTPPDGPPPLYGVTVRDGKLAGTERRVSPATHDFALTTTVDGRVLLVNAAGSDVRAFLGESPDPVQLSTVPASGDEVGVAAGKAGALAVWIADHKLLLARELGLDGRAGKSFTLSPLDKFAQQPIVVAAREGFIVAWLESGALRIARIVDHDVRFVTGGVPFDYMRGGTVEAVGTIDEQIYVVTSSRILRFTADGARLADVPMPALQPVAASVASNGFTLATIDGGHYRDTLCLHRLDASAHALDVPACTTLEGGFAAYSGLPLHLEWNAGSFYATSLLYGTDGLPEGHVEHWRCVAPASAKAIEAFAAKRTRELAEVARHAAQSRTPWPAVLPCVTFTTLAAQRGDGDDMRWLADSGERHFRADPLGGTATPHPIDARIAIERPSWVAGSSLSPPYVQLTLACADDSSIEWRCDGLRQRCNAEVLYASHEPTVTGRRGRDCADSFKTHARLSPVEQSRALLGNALSLVERACKGNRCAPRLEQVAARLRAAQAQRDWTVEPSAPHKTRLSADDKEIDLSCEAWNGSNRCDVGMSIDSDYLYFQQSEDQTDCTTLEILKLSGAGDNTLREDETGIQISGEALRSDPPP